MTNTVDVDCKETHSPIVNLIAFSYKNDLMRNVRDFDNDGSMGYPFTRALDQGAAA